MKNWNDIQVVLHEFYNNHEIKNDRFKKDNEYLRDAYFEIENIWENEFKKIDKIKAIMFSEAPFWGKNKKYFYNSDSPVTDFLNYEALEKATNINFINKKQLIDKINELGIIICDILPFSFNPTITKFNYRKITENDYISILKKTLEFHLQKKILKIKTKSVNEPEILFRYKRVKENSHTIVKNELENNNMLSEEALVHNLWKNKGKIDIDKFKKAVKIIISKSATNKSLNSDATCVR